MYRSLATLKQVEIQNPVQVERIQKYTPNTAIWLFVRDPKKLKETEREDVAAFCLASAPLKKAYGLLQDFLSMVHQREEYRLDAWLVRAAESGLPELQSFASGIEKDRYPQIAPEGHFQTPSDCIALNCRNDGFREQHPCDA